MDVRLIKDTSGNPYKLLPEAGIEPARSITEPMDFIEYNLLWYIDHVFLSHSVNRWTPYGHSKRKRNIYGL
jgi:hypothetical protein